MQHYRTRSFRLAKQGRHQILALFSYRDRRNRKRDLRALWITRINNASRELGLSYSQLMAGLKQKAFLSTVRSSPNLPSTNPKLSKPSLKP